MIVINTLIVYADEESGMLLKPCNFPELNRVTTTGPVPPKEVLPPLPADPSRNETLISEVPAYIWRHGCSPTSTAMILGYWDIMVYENLIDGDASTQTEVIDQIIASGGDASGSYPPGQEQHYEDYSLPKDSYGGDLLQDDYITAGRTPHVDNSLADFMGTSRSTSWLFYGWTWVSEMKAGFDNFLSFHTNEHQGTSSVYLEFGAGLTWSVFTSEIDNGCPMIFIVDTIGNNSEDHAVAAIGYRDDMGYQEYACYSTWSGDIRWERFREPSHTYLWGVGGGFTYRLDGDHYIWTDFHYSGIEDGKFETPYSLLSDAVNSAAPGDTIILKKGTSSESLTISKNLTIKAIRGDATIGG